MSIDQVLQRIDDHREDAIEGLLEYLRIPAHAAVSATVDAVNPLDRTWARGLVNAIVHQNMLVRDTRRAAQRLSEAHDNFTYVPALDNPLPEDNWEGFSGFVHEAAIDHFDGKFSGPDTRRSLGRGDGRV